MRESALVKYGTRTVSTSIGNPCSVEFDFLGVKEFVKSLKNYDPFDLCFIHVHPPGVRGYSEMDRLFFLPFAKFFGDARFGIVLFNNSNVNDTGCEYLEYCVRDSDVVQFDGFDYPPLSETDFLILKAMSYGYDGREG